jgi:hypothetical protein
MRLGAKVAANNSIIDLKTPSWNLVKMFFGEPDSL